MLLKDITQTYTHTDRQTDTERDRETVIVSVYLNIRLRPVTEDLIDVTNVINSHIQTPTHTITI